MLVPKKFSLDVPERVHVYDLSGEPVKEIVLPKVFRVPIRVDLIRRAFLSAFTARLQPKGRDPMAGKRTTAESLGVGLGIARIPRQKGTQRGRFIVFTVGGRRAFPPRTEKRIHERINRKEKRLAILSAIAATTIKEFVERRGHDANPPEIPLIVSDDIANISKTGELKEVLVKLGLWSDVERAYKGRKIRAGKGKMRGRRYRTPKSILIVSHNTVNILKAARNLPGVDVASPENLSILHLAPGGVPGRLTVYTETALKILEDKFRGVVC